MAQLASAFFALTVLVAAAPAHAGDAFTGFQMDGRAQYFAYLGVQENLPFEALGFQPYAQLFGAGQQYEYESGGRDVEAEIQFLTPSLGLRKSFEGTGWSVSALVGPRLQWKSEEGVGGGDSNQDFDAGVFAQIEPMYWQEAYSVHGIFSYGSIDDFFFGRLRGKHLAYEPEQGAGCCKLFAGMDVAGMGNRDFKQVQVGPVFEVPLGHFFVLFRGGYQYDSSFDDGGYGGLELYTPF